MATYSRQILAKSFAIVLLCSSFCSAALAENQELRTRILEIVSSRHPSDRPETWTSLGLQAPSEIIRLYSESDNLHQKIRLIEGLGWFSSDSTARTFLKQQADSSKERMIQSTAVTSVLRSGGESEVEFAARFLKNPSEQTRFEVARSILRFGGASGKKAVEEYLKQEPLTWISQRIKGEAVPIGPLQVTGSSLHQLPAFWSGRWKGVWLIPQFESTSFRAVSIEIDLQVQDDTARFKLVPPPKGSALPATSWSGTLKRSSQAGKSVTYSGSLSILGVSSALQPEVRESPQGVELGFTPKSGLGRIELLKPIPRN